MLGLALWAAGALWTSVRFCHYFGLFGQTARWLVAGGVFLFVCGFWCLSFARMSERKPLGIALALIGVGLIAAAFVMKLL